MTKRSGTGRFVGRNRFVLLFGTLVGLCALGSILHQFRDAFHPRVPPFLEGMVFVGFLLVAIVPIANGRGGRLFVLMFALPAVALWFVGVVVESDAVIVARHLFLAPFLGYMIWVMFRVIFDSQQVTFNTVCASLCIYLLLGIVWSLAYSLVDVLDPAAFTRATPEGSQPTQLRIGRGDTRALYFSFATLTTLGYGDIVPTSPICRMLAIFEAIAGQLYLAVMVARLVGMHIVHSMEGNKAQGGAPRGEDDCT
ncbi:MAG: potassium channel family protein [Gemmataceae bacterium]